MTVRIVMRFPSMALIAYYLHLASSGLTEHC